MGRLTRTSRERDRALEQRLRIRDLSIAIAAAGTIVFAGVAAATIPGHAATSSSASSGGSSGTSPASSGSSSSGSLQAPLQLPTSAPAGSGGVVTGGS